MPLSIEGSMLSTLQLREMLFKARMRRTEIMSRPQTVDNIMPRIKTAEWMIRWENEIIKHIHYPWTPTSDC